MQTRLRILAIGIITILISSPGCEGGAMDVNNPGEHSENVSPVEGNNRFALELYSEIKSKEGNLFLSPFSISSALAMTYAGARGETEKQMQEVLHFGSNQKGFHGDFKELIDDMNMGSGARRAGIQLNTANALWLQKDYEFLEAFTSLVQEYYGAGLNSVDFIKETERSRIKINDWVEGKTQGKIKDLIKPGALDQMTRLVLTNAIYFKGEWANKFDEEMTRKDTFYTGKSQVDALFMNQKDDFRYFENDAIQALELPYAGDSVSMEILLPKSRNGLPELEDSLSYSDCQSWTSSFRQVEVDVSIPKFEITSEFSLRGTLSRMGMPLAFSESADLSGMTGGTELQISEALHKAFVVVNEEGTEAAAATGVVVGIKAAMPGETKVFKADHPFLFVIKDRNTNSVLFMGRVQNLGQ